MFCQQPVFKGSQLMRHCKNIPINNNLCCGLTNSRTFFTNLISSWLLCQAQTSWQPCPVEYWKKPFVGVSRQATFALHEDIEELGVSNVCPIACYVNAKHMLVQNAPEWLRQIFLLSSVTSWAVFGHVGVLNLSVCQRFHWQVIMADSHTRKNCRPFGWCWNFIKLPNGFSRHGGRQLGEVGSWDTTAELWWWSQYVDPW